MQTSFTVTEVDVADETMLDDMNRTAKARNYLSFHLNFMMLMLSCGRDEAAERSLRLLASGIQELPEDLHINIDEETYNA